MSGPGTPAAIDARPPAAASPYPTKTTTRRGQLKPLAQQIIVITGASSGIGLCTARMAANRGARLVLNSRNEAALRQLADEINGQGGEAMYQVADVADEAALRVVADLAIARFGGFDTWVNNAGVSIYGRMIDVPDADHRRLLDTNFWGVVNGSRIAAEYLRHRGGAVINIGSTLSDRAIPGQSPGPEPVRLERARGDCAGHHASHRGHGRHVSHRANSSGDHRAGGGDHRGADARPILPRPWHG
jgi:NAD(P)-dependent dehydrogenase (short-subunit alcohol dehydrogenase family)